MNIVSKFSYQLIWLVSFFVGVQVHAEDRMSGTLSVSRSTYLSESPTLDQRGDFSYFGANLQEALSFGNTKFVAKANGTFAAGSETERYFAVPEFYYQIHSREEEQKVKFSIGRKVEAWSDFDDQWKLGLWQPLARWDYLHPETQGLLGLFLDVKASSKVRVIAVYSPLFIPDQGPGFKLNDGQFESDNRWFLAPQSKFFLNDESSNIHYDLDRPRVWDIVNQQGGAVKMEVGDLQEGVWMRAAYASLPSNQLHLGIDPNKSIALKSVRETYVTIHPIVVRHEIASLETGIRGEKSAATVSYTIDNPRKPDLPAKWEESILRKTRFLGISLERRMPLWDVKRSTVKAHYLKRWDDADRTTGSGPVGDQVESSLDRFPYEEMAGLEWSARLWNTVRRDLNISMRYLYSIPEKGALLSTYISLKTSREIKWNFGFDIIGAAGSGTRGLMGRYRSNDRVVGGVSYVF